MHTVIFSPVEFLCILLLEETCVQAPALQSRAQVSALSRGSSTSPVTPTPTPGSTALGQESPSPSDFPRGESESRRARAPGFPNSTGHRPPPSPPSRMPRCDARPGEEAERLGEQQAGLWEGVRRTCVSGTAFWTPAGNPPPNHWGHLDLGSPQLAHGHPQPCTHLTRIPSPGGWRSVCAPEGGGCEPQQVSVSGIGRKCSRLSIQQDPRDSEQEGGCQLPAWLHRV